jgi:transposase
VENKEQYANLEAYCSALEKQNELYKRKIERLELLEWELAQIKRMIFGSKSEKAPVVHAGQMSLFELAQEQKPDAAIEQISYQRNKPSADKTKPTRSELPASLARVEEVIEPDPLPQGAQRIGEEVTEILEYEPGKLYVRRIIRPKYAIKGSPEQGIFCGVLPELPLARSNAGPGILSHLLIGKYVDHLPFYRQVKQFERQGIRLAESTISGWFTQTCKQLVPLYDKMVEALLSQDYIMADETPIKVLDSLKTRSTHRGYHWAYYAPKAKLALFDYREGRGREGPNDFLKNYQGVLQTDGYTVYDQLKQKNQITHAGCMAHVRRKFFEAKEQDPMRAKIAMDYIGKLYAIEKHLRETDPTPEQILQQREPSLVLLKEFKSWIQDQLNSGKVLPKSAIGKAMAYTLNQWDKLLVYTQHAQVQIDNNLIENSIRPIAVGRKNYLFAGSHQAAQNAAMLYSFLGSCKINQVEPFAWLKKVLETINETKASQLHLLFPNNLSL